MSKSTLFVARGRSLCLDKVVYDQGSQVTLPAEDADYLAARGFLQDTPPNLAPAVLEPNPANIGRQFAADVQGPRDK